MHRAYYQSDYLAIIIPQAGGCIITLNWGGLVEKKKKQLRLAYV